MKILFMSPAGGNGLGVAVAMADEGHEVMYWTTPDRKDSGKGFAGIVKVPSWQPHVREVDFVVMDMVKMGKEADAIRKVKPLIGGASFADTLELDRELGQQFMEDTGATIPEYKRFKSIGDGLSFLEKADGPYVFKPDGNEQTDWTYVPKGEDNKGLISFMKNLPKQSLDFILQKKILDECVEISTEGWFNGREFISPFNHTIEKKRLMEGDRGPNTGCMGNLVWTVYQDKITEELLMPLEEKLAKAGYIGPLDINCMVSEKDANFLEITGRFGYDAIQTLLQGTTEKTSFLFGVATGSINSHDFYSGYSIGVRLSVAPFPNKEGNLEGVNGMKVICCPPGSFWPADIMKKPSEDEEGMEDYLLTGPLVGVQTALNETIDGARELCYERIDDEVISKDVQYRCDIGEGAAEDIEKLKKWGWL